MNARRSLLWATAAVAWPALAADPVQLPELYLYRYQPSHRDPFISASATRTLVAGERQVTDVVSGRILEQYLQTLARLIRKELFVEGVSTGDENEPAVALINGVTFRTGDGIPVPAPAEEVSQLEALSRSYGLPLRRSAAGADNVVFEVGLIRESGVGIVLPGFKGSLCEIPFEGDLGAAPVQLERKRQTNK